MTTAEDFSNKSCLNCGAAISGKYCYNCGQSASVGRITFRETVSQFLSASFSLQGPLLSTTRGLVLNPGKVFREFIAGRRKTYYQPVSYFVLLTAVYIIIRLIIDFDPFQNQVENAEHDRNAENSNLGMQAAKYMVEKINYIMFFLVFGIGLSLKLFFRKQYNLAEYTTVGFYISGIYVMADIAFMLVGKYLLVNIGYAQLLFLCAWIFYSTYSLINRFNFWMVIKYLLVSAFSVVLYIVLGFGFSLLVVLSSR